MFESGLRGLSTTSEILEDSALRAERACPGSIISDPPRRQTPLERVQVESEEGDPDVRLGIKGK